MATLAPSIEKTGGGLRHWLAMGRWNFSRALIITRREVTDMFRDWRILAPIIILTVIFPSIANWGAGRMMRWVGRYGAEIVGERLIPFLMMVVGFFPISFSLIIALETFVGEKERHSLEPLLATPLTNTQLYIGKTLSATLPPLVGSYLGITVYLIGLYYNIRWEPPAVLLIQILLLTTVQALLMVAGAVVVSSQTTSVRAANLLASFIIIPMSFLIQGEAIIMFWAQYDVLWWILGGLLVLTVVLVRMGARIFNREELLGREIDQLNLSASARKLLRLVQARVAPGQKRRSAWRWYREEVLGIIPRMGGAVALMTGAMLAGYFIGTTLIKDFPIPQDVFLVEGWADRFLDIIGRVQGMGPGSVLLTLGQNVRVLALASMLAVFSLGVLAAIILMVPTGILGYLGPQIVASGVPPLVFWMAVIPHSLLEIPAAILAGAVAMRLGASVLAPPPGKTVGEGWMAAFADAIRMWLGLILPLLVMAALTEVYLTPWWVMVVAGRGG